MGNPVALFLLSEISVFAVYCLDHHDREIVYGVAWGVKTGSYWFVKPLVVDIAVVSVEADMKVLCLSHVHWYSRSISSSTPPLQSSLVSTLSFQKSGEKIVL